MSGSAVTNANHPIPPQARARTERTVLYARLVRVHDASGVIPGTIVNINWINSKITMFVTHAPEEVKVGRRDHNGVRG